MSAPVKNGKSPSGKAIAILTCIGIALLVLGQWIALLGAGLFIGVILAIFSLARKS